MSRITSTVGLILVAVGLVGYFTSDSRHFTALIPAIIGVLMVVLAFLAMRSESASRHFMHVAMLVALLGAAGVSSRAFDLFDGGGTMAVVSAITWIVLVVYLILGIQSFRAARRSR